MRWLTNFNDFRFKWTATAGIQIHPTKAWLLQLVNFEDAIWHFRRTICNKIVFWTWKNATETYGMLQTAFGVSCMNKASVLGWDSRKVGSLWGIMRGVGGVRKSIHHSWLEPKRLTVSIRCATGPEGRSRMDNDLWGQKIHPGEHCQKIAVSNPTQVGQRYTWSPKRGAMDNNYGRQ